MFRILTPHIAFNEVTYSRNDILLHRSAADDEELYPYANVRHTKAPKSIPN